MKRLCALLLVFIMAFCMASASHGETLLEEIERILGNQAVFGEVGDKLVFITEYGSVLGETGSESILPKHKDELKKYSSIILMMTRNGTMYMIGEIPVVDGEIMNDNINMLMSTAFIMENMKLGQ